MARLGLRGRAAVGFAASCAVAIVVSLAAAGALLTGGLQAGDEGEYLTEALRELGAERGVDDSEIAPLLDLALDDAPVGLEDCLLYTSPSPRDRQKSRMPSSA